MSATGDRRAGIALIEAMVVIAITVMIGAIAYPELRAGLASVAFQQAAAGLRADLRMARAQARTSGARVDLMVAEDGAAYGWTPGPRRVLIGDLRLSAPSARTSFFPDGSSVGGRLRLTDGRRGLDIAVAPLTGVLEPGA
ncbi:pilus assembly FimT family protein [Caulobacter soli]|uniref:pilus assembly FimT family protein n=1 Tax=Caulobacter soli TaxID=2708539 RepID=UPI0013EA56A5|nr:GspH/FimT family pseudopilin [Caulobacter soli]